MKKRYGTYFEIRIGIRIIQACEFSSRTIFDGRHSLLNAYRNFQGLEFYHLAEHDEYMSTK